MRRQVRCPNCGGGHTLVNPGIFMLVCDYCQTSFYWDKDRVAKMGERSVLPESDSLLFLGASGKILGKRYQVVGHVRYEHYRGSWDEWYLDIGGTKAAWVSEDERNLTLERRITPDEPIAPVEQLTAGMRVRLSGRVFTIREVGRAKCAGGQGQLPFPVLPGEEYPYLDLATADGQQFATLEWDEAGNLHAFLGRPLTRDQISLDTPKPEVERDESHGAGDVECPNCGAPLEKPTGRVVETLVCTYCGANNDLTGAAARTMGVNPKGTDPRFRFEIGDQGRFEGADYEVCGRLFARDEEGYESREYLLWNPQRDYLWLAEEDGHYLLLKPTRQVPDPDPLTAGPLLGPKSPIRVGGKEFAFYETCNEQLAYVDGALPWLASVTQGFGSARMIAPPQVFEMEFEGGEVEYFQGSYMEAEAVWQAFGRKPPAPAAKGVHPAQPFERSPLAATLMWVGGIFALVNLALAAWSILDIGQERIFEQHFDPGDYLEEGLSDPFQLGSGRVVRLALSAPVDNSWLALDLALVDPDGRVQAEAGGEVAYYHGYDDGPWSEGSQDSDSYFQAPGPGTYRLIVHGEAGDGQAPGLTVRLYQGGMLTRYFLVLAVVSGLFWLFEFYRHWLFEARRWAPVMEDDDDDDDDDEDEGLLRLIS
jgi:hypothetical protein